MSLADWDRYVAPALRRVEELAHQIQTRTMEINACVNGLRVRPDWMTKAEHEVIQAIDLLERHQQTTAVVLRDLQTAMATYHERPTNE